MPSPVIDTYADAPGGDNFDNFCQERDRREDGSESAHYVSRDVPGYADLDDHGVWTENPQYGMVWAPRVDPGWAPYQTGHWAWISPWGWTWVDDAPWGYAPFHYGRWAYTPAGWVWIPGLSGDSSGLRTGSGGVGWRTSLWCECRDRRRSGGGLVRAWARRSVGPRVSASVRAYFSRVNVSNTVIVNQVHITNVYNATYVNRTTVQQGG